MFRIIKFKSVKTLIFITWKEKDHINPDGNTKIKPSYALQCFCPGVEIRTLSQFGTGSQLFLKMPVCSVNSDIFFTVHVAFMILKMSDFQDWLWMAITSRKFNPKGTHKSSGHCPLSKT